MKMNLYEEMAVKVNIITVSCCHEWSVVAGDTLYACTSRVRGPGNTVIREVKAFTPNPMRFPHTGLTPVHDVFCCLEVTEAAITTSESDP